MADTKGSEFYVSLQGIKLPKEVEARIADSIRRTVARELAALDLRPQRGGKSGADKGGGKAPAKGAAGAQTAPLISRKDWYGYILMKAIGAGITNQFHGTAVDAGKTIETQILTKGVR